MNDQNIMFGYTLSKNSKIVNSNKLILMNVLFIYVPLFYLGHIIYLAKILRSLLSKKK